MSMGEKVMPEEFRMMSTTPPIDLIKWGFMSFHILAACCEWELFPFIAEGGESGRTPKEIAAHFELPAHSLRVLLLACCAYGLLRKDPQSGCYLNTLKMDQSYELLRLQLRYAEQVVQPAFEFLRESLQSGTNRGVETLPGPGAPVYERLANNPELEAAFHGA